MKIIFLDIDGVLNHQAYYESDRWDKNGGRDSDIDPKCVEYLNMIISDTGAKVVISSTWRIGRTVEQLQEALNKKGFKGEIVGFTPRLAFKDIASIPRGVEIDLWLKENCKLFEKCIRYWEYKEYVILDDDSDMLLCQKDNFINVDSFVGMTLGTVFRAIKILNQGTR